MFEKNKMNSTYYMASRTKRIKQGDPLIPFLFNIVVEGLSGLMRMAKVKNLFHGV